MQNHFDPEETLENGFLYIICKLIQKRKKIKRTTSLIFGAVKLKKGISKYKTLFNYKRRRHLILSLKPTKYENS